MCPTSSASREAHRLSAPWGTRSTSSAWRTSSGRGGEFLGGAHPGRAGDIIEVLEEAGPPAGLDGLGNPPRQKRKGPAQRHFPGALLPGEGAGGLTRGGSGYGRLFQRGPALCGHGADHRPAGRQRPPGRKNYLTEGMCLGLALGVAWRTRCTWSWAWPCLWGCCWGGPGQLAPKGGKESSKEDDHEPIDTFSYELGAADCFCEMVRAG